MKNLSLLPLFFILSLFSGIGQTLRYSEIKTGSDIVVGQGVIEHMDPEFRRIQLSPSWTFELDNYGVRNIITLQLNREALLTGSPFTGEITGIVTYYDEDNISHTLPFELDVSYDPSGAGATHKDADALVFTGGHAVSVEILTKTGDATLMELESVIEVTRYYTFDANVAPTSLDAQFSGNDEIEFNWRYIEGAVEYELEWVYINNYDEGLGATLPTTSLNFDFKNNSTRVSTTKTSYRISNVFDQGYIIYRVRGVGRKGSDYQYRLEGKWSTLSTGTVNNANDFISVSAHEPSINWGYQASYTEGAKRFEGISYSDGLGFTRQQQGRNNTEDLSIVQETYYDHQGRPALSALPAPSTNGSLEYKANFNQNTSGAHYSKSDFDLDNGGDCHTPTGAMGTANGAGQYYSPSNPNQSAFQSLIPDAEGYPLMRVEYMPDNTGRIRSSGMAGDDFQVGNSGNRVTTYEYGTPTQEQLDILFGTDVGLSQRYQRNIITDANGQKSVSYIDPYGRVIATALIGDNPQGLQALPTNTGSAQVTQEWLDNNTIQDESGVGALEFKKTFVVGVPGFYDFSYTISPEQFTDVSCLPAGICYDCEYELTLELVDVNCGDVIFSYYNPNITGLPLDASCGSATPFVVDKNVEAALNTQLGAGTYSLRKVLRVTQASIDYYLANYLEENTCLSTYEDFYQDILSGVDFSGCEGDYCTLICVAEHGTYAEYLVNNPSATQQDYDDVIANCIASCEDNLSDPCESQKAQLIADYYPGGQYATYTGTYPNYTISDPTSIFYDDNTWKNSPSVYLNTDGTTSLITVIPDGLGNYIPPVSNTGNVINNAGTYTTPPNNLSNVSDFIARYQYSWAEVFLPNHPEYCYYEYCVLHSASNDYNNAMNNTNSLSQAITLGYINPLGFTSGSAYPSNITYSTANPDLYFSGINTPSVIQGQISNAMQVFAQIDGVNRSIWEVAYINTFCPDATLNADVVTCLNGGFNDFGVGTCYEDVLWANFRDLYQQLKTFYYNKARTDYAIEHGCYNGCIGELQSEFVTDQSLDYFTAFPEGCTSGCTNEYSGIPSSINNMCNSVVVTTGYYENKFPHFYNEHQNAYYGMTFAQAWSQAQTGIDNTTASSCASVCEVKVEQWMASISGCASTPSTWVAGNTLYDNIYNGLLQVCVDGCDITHPGGSTTVAPGTSGTYSSVDDVLISYLGSGYETSICSPLLIEDNSYDGSALNTYAGALDNCACDKISSTIAEFALGGLPTGVVTIEDLFIHKYGILPGNINSLSCECTATSGVGNVNVGVPLQYSCEDCLPCATVQTAYDNFVTSNIATPADPNYDLLLRNYMNDALGYHLSADDYENFLQDCIDYSNGSMTGSCTATDEFNDLMTLLNNLKSLNKFTTTSPAYDLMTNPAFTGSSLLGYADNSSSPSVARYYTNYTAGSTFALEIYFGDPNAPCTLDLVSPIAIDWDRITSIGSPELVSNCPDNSTTYNFTVEVVMPGVQNPIIVEGTMSTNCFPVAECDCGVPTLCDFSIDFTPPTSNCVENLLNQVELEATYAYSQYIAGVSEDFVTAYIQQCLGGISNETLTVTYDENEYHHTLFYYDQAGNLYKTVPPKGVDYSVVLADVNTYKGAPNDQLPNPIFQVIPTHTLATTYKYNTLNQLIEQTTPDGGTTYFWYDAYGRIAVSQNAKQVADDYYSYTKYDVLGRLIEGGQVVTTAISEAIVKDPVALENWINGGTRHEVTRSYYDFTLDASIAIQFNQGQKYLRNRISTVAYYDQNYTGSNLAYDHATHYSYDVHGNVIEVIQDNKELAYLGQDTKHTEYEFELVSGNVNKVKYQDGQNDAYYHEYCYDADNRLDKVFSSEDDVIYDQEAHYHYYQHGPMARTELGDWQVQGTDYAYTINGWLKGVNANVLDAKSDMGKDGAVDAYQTGYTQIHEDFARDAFGFTLSYFDGDYSAIKNTQNDFHSSLNNITTTGYTQNLGNAMYNGNIRSMATALMDENESPIDQIANFYSYDQLHRIKQMDAYLGVDYTNASNTNAFKTTYSYDANGNLLTLTRNDALGAAMDDFTYNYDNSTTDNKLSSVQDAVSNTGSLGYGDVQHGQGTSGNYTYSEIGELIQDKQEGIENIEWRYGDRKISKITRSINAQNGNTTNTDFEQTEYKYDVFGRRVLKLSKPVSNGVIGSVDLWKYTYYSYDASGNVMGVYELEKNTTAQTEEFTEKEAHIYGGGRLGLHKLDKLLTIYNSNTQTATEQQPAETERVMGEKYYELSNHLGNVLTVVSDRKVTLLDINSNPYYAADVISYSDYYPFGMVMPGRNGSEGDYRYGFNGMEKDNEVKGNNNHYTTPFRQYDPRIGRWMSLDPLMEIFPDVSPFVAFDNNPIYFSDPWGLAPEGGDKPKGQTSGTNEQGEFYVNVPRKTKFDIRPSNILNLIANGINSIRKYSRDNLSIDYSYEITIDYDIYVDEGSGFLWSDRIYPYPSGATLIDYHIKLTYDGKGEIRHTADVTYVTEYHVHSPATSVKESATIVQDTRENMIQDIKFLAKQEINNPLNSKLNQLDFMFSMGSPAIMIEEVLFSAAVKGIERLSVASKYGFGSYSDLKKSVLKTEGTNSGLEVHHLYEQRFAATLGEIPDEMMSIVLSKVEHRTFTKAWQEMIPYKNSKSIINTTTASPTQIKAAAKEIYKDYPEILKKLGL